MPAQKLICAKCGHHNEPQRVYCHNCGEKLDRSALKSDDTQKTSKKAAKKAADKLARPNVPVFRVYILPIIWAVLTGAVVASLICILTPPEKMPAEIPEGLRLDPPNLGLVLEKILEMPSPGRFGIPEEQLNAYLSSRVGARTSPGIGFMIAWDRAASAISKGKATLMIIRRIVPGSETPKKNEMAEHFPLVVQTDFEVRLTESESGITARATGGRIGRLIVPGPVMDLAKGMFFGELAGVFKQEIKLLSRMKSITFEDGVIQIESPAPGGR